MSQTEKRFDNWTDVDCNECANYWTSSCDGASEGARKPCNSFIAQRNVNIPAEIKSLRKQIEGLKTSLTVTQWVLQIIMVVLIWQILRG